MTNYTKNQLWELYLKLPQEIKDITTSEQTTEVINKILDEKDLPDESVKQIYALIRNVLYGLLSPEDFRPSLEKEIGLDAETAKKIATEINRFVFFPVKESLGQLYQQEAAPTPPPPGATPTAKQPPVPTKEDVYREPTE